MSTVASRPKERTREARFRVSATPDKRPLILRLLLIIKRGPHTLPYNTEISLPGLFEKISLKLKSKSLQEPSQVDVLYVIQSVY
jgi:hypothetical protein